MRIVNINADESGEVAVTPAMQFNPATDELIESLWNTLAERQQHDHPQGGDIYCLNLAGYMGERMGPVLTRLRELAAENERLRNQLDKPCGSCHPCTNWADETWRAAGRKPPTPGEWDELRAEVERLTGIETESTEPGAQVRDSDRDVWTRGEDGLWHCGRAVPRTWTTLRDDYGPLYRVASGGAS